jgi:hypothetical protein
MASTNLVNEVIDALTKWSASIELVKTTVAENSPEWSNSTDDYEILKEFAFSPSSAAKAYLTVSVTTEGLTGVGIERWSRIAARASLKSPRVDRYAAGFEPTKRSPEQVIALCEHVAAGDIEIEAFSIFGCLVTCSTRLAGYLHPASDIDLGVNVPLFSALKGFNMARSTLVTFVPWKSID